MKYILIIGDGMADNPVPELGGLTPLEYAKKPFIDELAAHGEDVHFRLRPEPLLHGTRAA